MSGCNTCNQNPCNPCQRGCKPARYSQGFGSECKCPEETDTKLSLDVGRATLNYSAERHTDVITGSQLGSIITIPDLRDTDIDYDSFDSMCAEFIYHKYGECGDGCRSAKDAWTTFALDDEGAKQNAIRYVRGANAYGCPVFLDVPPTLNEYWYAGWRTDGDGNKQFGYYQANSVPELPKNPNGDYLVSSQDPNTKQPIVAPLPLNCILGNLMGNLGMNVDAVFSKTIEYVYINGTFNASTGAFSIKWEDWYYNKTRHVGDGYVTGTINLTSSFDIQTGNMVYTVAGITYDKVNYITDQGAPSTAQPIYLTLRGYDITTGAEVPFGIEHKQFNPNTNWTWNINQTVSWSDYKISVAPNSTLSPLNFLYIFVDWESTFDDEGYMQLIFSNKLQGWNPC